MLCCAVQCSAAQLVNFCRSTFSNCYRSAVTSTTKLINSTKIFIAEFIYVTDSPLVSINSELKIGGGLSQYLTMSVTCQADKLLKTSDDLIKLISTDLLTP